MTITYLIGNGFDIGLGLKTGYLDFIGWYLNQPPKARAEIWLKKVMAGNLAQWSDAEKAFGQLRFSQYGENAIEIYDEGYDAFVAAFHDYLVAENKRFNIPKSDRHAVAERFVTHAVKLNAFMSQGAAEAYVNQLPKSVDINFVTFNYTDTLAQILDFEDGEENEYSVEVVPGVTCRVRVRQICHVHGTLDADYVFGVDHPGQIAEPTVRQYCERNGGMLKARSAEKLRVPNRKWGMSLIDSSDRIVTFGLSFGESDMSWWLTLEQHVFYNNRSLIVCPFRDELPHGLSLKKRNDIYNEEKKRVFHVLLQKDAQRIVRLEAVDPPHITVLRPKSIHDAQGIMRKCDYFRITDIGWKYIQK